MRALSMRWVVGVLVLGLVCLTVARSELEDDLDDMDLEDTLDATEEELDEQPAPAESEAQKERPAYQTPVPKGKAYFVDTFDDSLIGQKWILSQAKKDDADENIAKYNGEWSIEEPNDSPLVGDQGLVLKSRAKLHAVSANLDETFDFKDKPLVMQYEVKFQSGQECGGAYVKLLTEDNAFNPKQFADKTPYTIMFGPDKCGNDNKLHFIFRHKNPITGKYEEKHAKKPSGELGVYFTDKKTHLYTLVLHPDNTFEIFVDQTLINSGSLLEDFEPPVNPPKQITDPNDKKPTNWDEREKIQDPEAVKPDDWNEDAPEIIEDEDAVKPEGWLDDEPELTADPEAEKPSDWDEDMDGEWEPPMINNPKCESAPGCGEWKVPTKKNPDYRGKWKAPMIDNPAYQGKWKPRMIENPDYFEDTDPFSTMTSIAALGLELWSMSDDIYFDNFIVAEDKAVVDQFATESWELKSAQETSGGLSGAAASSMRWLIDSTEENPWLWAVYLTVTLLPITLIYMICCRGTKSQPDEVRHHKKTDDQQPDDAEEEPVNEVDAGGSGDAQATPATTTAKATDAADRKKSSKGALEADQAEEADVEDDDEEEEEEEDEQEEKPESKATPTRTSPRKRKTKPQKE